MPINILDHNPYLEVLQVKTNKIQEYKDFKEIAMVMDYAESKQMAATVYGKAEISDEMPSEEQIKQAEEEVRKDEDPFEVLRRMAREDGYRDDDDEDEEDDDDGGIGVI